MSASLEKVTRIISDVLDISEIEITPDSSINVFGKLDSLSFEKVVLSIEEYLGFQIDPARFLDIENVQQLADFVQEMEGSKAVKANLSPSGDPI